MDVLCSVVRVIPAFTHSLHFNLPVQKILIKFFVFFDIFLENAHIYRLYDPICLKYLEMIDFHMLKTFRKRKLWLIFWFVTPIFNCYQ